MNQPVHSRADLGKIFVALEWDDGMEVSYERLGLAKRKG